MRIVTTREFRNSSASVLDAVEAGETIAATASMLGLPLFTRNPKDFAGLETMLEVVGV